MWVMKKTMESILVVDDDPEIREGVADVLRQAGYDVDEAKDGKRPSSALKLDLMIWCLPI